MRVSTRLFILGHPEHDEPAPKGFINAVSEAGGVVREPGHGRLIIEAPVERANEILAAMRAAEDAGEADLKGMRIYGLPEPSGVDLIVNFMYRESGQVCSATVDERLWSTMTGPEGEDTADAFAALYRDVEIYPSYEPGRSIIVQDVMRGVEHWSPQDARDGDPELRDEDEPMAEIRFTAMAEAAGKDGTLIEVDLTGTGSPHLTWKIPARLVPPPCPVNRHEDLARLPSAPKKAREWARVAPCAIEVIMP